MEEDEEDLRLYYVTCPCEACPNHSVTIEVIAPAGNPHVICGPCETLLTPTIAA